MTGSNKEALKSRMWKDAKEFVRSSYMLDHAAITISEETNIAN
jgi:hypothetical protein